MSGAQTIHAGASLGLPAPWTDQTGTALRRPDGSTAEIGIASCTWAELQAEYPNNGAALLALPAHTMRFVSDWQALFVRNVAWTYWVPVGGVVVLARLGAKSTHTGTTADTVIHSVSIPAGLMTPTSGLRWRCGVIAAANTGMAFIRTKFDTTQIDSNSVAASSKYSALTQYRNVGATNVGAYEFNMSFVAATTFETSAAFAVNTVCALNNAADSVVLHSMELELF